MWQKLSFFLVFWHSSFDRYYRWVGRYYRPIISAAVTDIIGRYIGIGRSLVLCKLKKISQEFGYESTVSITLRGCVCLCSLLEKDGWHINSLLIFGPRTSSSSEFLF